MESDKKELFVRDISTFEAGPPVVIGLPNNGKAIRVGDVFKARYDLPMTLEDVVNEAPHLACTNRVEINLTVSAIEWPKKHQAEELPHGHTGALHLTGSGIESVSRNCFLAT